MITTAKIATPAVQIDSETAMFDILVSGRHFGVVARGLDVASLMAGEVVTIIGDLVSMAGRIVLNAQRISVDMSLQAATA